MLELTVADPQGRNIKWKLYSVSFNSPDGFFGFHIYAISDGHAQLQIEAIRETAKLEGQIVNLSEW